MFCCKCGTRNPDDANYCHKCGSPLHTAEARNLVQGDKNRVSQPVEPPRSEEERRFIQELLPIDQKAHECHACRRKENLHGWDFGLGKKISTTRDWSGTALSVVVSAVTVPLLGAGGLQWPGKTKQYQILRLRLILCDSCWEGQAKYGLHPWWQTAIRLGYTEFFDAEKLKKLELAR
jgi:hypothetical protein